MRLLGSILSRLFGPKRGPRVKVKPWRGKWCLDYTDQFGHRRRPSFETKAEAEKEQERVRQQLLGPKLHATDPDVTLGAYYEQWMKDMAAAVKPRTLRSYKWAFTHILPFRWGPEGKPPKPVLKMRVRDVERRTVKALIGAKRAPLEGKPLSKESVRLIRVALHGLLEEAVDDEIISANPAAFTGRGRHHRKLLNLAATPAERDRKVKALSPEELEQLLFATKKEVPSHYLLFLFMARTGLRLGEALAVEWADVDLEACTIRVVRTVALADEDDDTPKSNRERTVDISRALRDALRTHQRAQKESALRKRRPVPKLVFPPRYGEHRDGGNVARAFRRARKKAGLADHFTPHSLRHTYACDMLGAGADIHYLQQQLGHEDVRITLNYYGKWRRRVNPGVVDRLGEKVELA